MDKEIEKKNLEQSEEIPIYVLAAFSSARWKRKEASACNNTSSMWL